MPLGRLGDTPSFYAFAIKYAVSYPGLTIPTTRAQPIEIPSFQRNIVWKRKEVEELVESESALFGTVILAQVHNRPWILVDGLQRFATATALLDLLYPEVISPKPRQPAASKYFSNLLREVQTQQPIYSHNSTALKSHPRDSIAQSYNRLYEAISELISENLADPKKLKGFAGAMERMFLDKQIALDPYVGFTSPAELTKTFITMNSKGIDLSPVDLLRAELVNQGLSLKWSSSDVSDVENEFTTTFETPVARAELKVLAKMLLDGLVISPVNVFPNWDKLKRKDIEDFLDFVNRSVNCATAHSKSFNPYLSEIFECGGLPFAITLVYFYKRYLPKKKFPDFSTSGLHPDLHQLLRAFYRRLLDGTIGKTGDIGQIAVQGEYTKTPKPRSIVDDINPTTAGPFASNPDDDWLRQHLREADSDDAKRVFNMYILPDRKAVGGTTFAPLKYGREAYDYSIDHLIPKAGIKRNKDGESDMNRLANFAPITHDLNSQAKHAPCSLKIAAGGLYDASLVNPHPYAKWLVGRSHAGKYCGHAKIKVDGVDVLPLDTQYCLTSNPKAPVGEDRIEHFSSVIRNKL